MHRLNVTALAFAAPAVLALSACGEQRAPTEATRATSPTVALSRSDDEKHAGAIVAHDACDPASFNAVIGPGTCVKPFRTTFQDFIAQLTATKVAKGWFFSPEQLTARLGVNLLGNNVGGEEHTFTPVARFGGGVVPILNQLSGNPVVAPECLQLDEDDLVPSGGKYIIEAEELADVVDDSGIARVECCIHPWMRTEVRLKG
jgi:hypothetical protein